MQSTSTSLFHQFPAFPPKSQTLPSRTRLLQSYRPRMASISGFRVWSQTGQGGSSSSSSSPGDNGFCSFMEYVGKRGLNVEDDLVILLYHIQYACKQIASLVASPFNYSLGKRSGLGSAAGGGSDRDSPKPLDIVSVYLYRECFLANV